MKSPNKPSYKLGANRNEMAKNPRKHDANFAQSRDICEDRGERQIKTARNQRTITPHRLPSKLNTENSVGVRSAKRPTAGTTL